MVTKTIFNNEANGTQVDAAMDDEGARDFHAGPETIDGSGSRRRTLRRLGLVSAVGIAVLLVARRLGKSARTGADDGSQHIPARVKAYAQANEIALGDAYVEVLEAGLETIEAQDESEHDR